MGLWIRAQTGFWLFRYTTKLILGPKVWKQELLLGSLEPEGCVTVRNLAHKPDKRISESFRCPAAV